MTHDVQAYIEVFRLFVFVGLLAAVAYYDLAQGRIPNKITFPVLAAGLLLALGASGWTGLRGALIGAALGGGIFLMVYLFGVATRKPLMGAGDVKLMAAVGAFAGPPGVLMSILYALFLAGTVAIVIVLVQVMRRAPLPKTLPFGAMLSLGTTLALFFNLPVFSRFFAERM